MFLVIFPTARALQGIDGNFSPNVDKGDQVYAAALALIDEATSQLSGSTAAKPANDLFYGGDPAKWISFANTLKLKAYLTTRLVDGSAKDKINGLLSGDLIDDESEDFEFEYGTNRDNPNSRHPLYNDSYETTDGDYMSNYYMWLLWDEKEIVDPRIRFYFYRQDLDLTDEDINIWECVYSNEPDLIVPGQMPDRHILQLLILTCLTVFAPWKVTLAVTTVTIKVFLLMDLSGLCTDYILLVVSLMITVRSLLKTVELMAH